MAHSWVIQDPCVLKALEENWSVGYLIDISACTLKKHDQWWKTAPNSFKQLLKANTSEWEYIRNLHFILKLYGEI